MPRIEEHIELHRLGCLASHGKLDHYEFALEKLAEFSEEDLRPEPLLTGHDLIGLGYQPGPLFSGNRALPQSCRGRFQRTVPLNASRAVRTSLGGSWIDSTGPSSMT